MQLFSVVLSIICALTFGIHGPNEYMGSNDFSERFPGKTVEFVNILHYDLVLLSFCVMFWYVIVDIIITAHVYSIRRDLASGNHNADFCILVAYSASAGILLFGPLEQNSVKFR